MKKRIRPIGIMLIIAAFMLSLTGCSSSKSGGDYSRSNYYAENGYYAEESSTSYYQASTETVSDEAWIEGESKGTSSSNQSAFDNAKLIYTATIQLETTHFDDVTKKLSEMTSQYGGYMEYSNVQNYSTYRYGEYTVRIPSENYGTFVSETKGMERVTSFSENVQNISQSYYDTELRLESAKTKLASLNDLMAKAEDMEDIITIQNAINDVQYEIDSLSGTLRNYDQLVGFSTIHLYINEVPELSDVQQPVIGFGQQLAQAFERGGARAVNFFKRLAINIAESWFALLVWAVIIVVAIILIKRAVKKSREKEQANAQARLMYQQQRMNYPQQPYANQQQAPGPVNAKAQAPSDQPENK